MILPHEKIEYCIGNRQDHISCKKKETKYLPYLHIPILMQETNSCNKNKFPVVIRKFLSRHDRKQKFPEKAKQEEKNLPLKECSGSRKEYKLLHRK